MLLDACAHTICKQHTVGHDDPASSSVFELTNHELEEEPCSLGGLLVGRKVGLNALLFLATKGRVGEDDLDALALGDLGDRPRERVASSDVGFADFVENEVHHPEQVGQWLLLD